MRIKLKVKPDAFCLIIQLRQLARTDSFYPSCSQIKKPALKNGNVRFWCSLAHTHTILSGGVGSRLRKLAPPSTPLLRAAVGVPPQTLPF